jgi:hypothetical protein
LIVSLMMLAVAALTIPTLASQPTRRRRDTRSAQRRLLAAVVGRLRGEPAVLAGLRSGPVRVRRITTTVAEWSMSPAITTLAYASIGAAVVSDVRRGAEAGDKRAPYLEAFAES